MFKKIFDNLFAYVPRGFSCNSYLIKTKKLTLIDSGLENQSALLKDSLEAIGFNADSIELVLHTHGHADHIGADAVFPNAKIMMSEADGLKVNSRDPDFTVSEWFNQHSYPKVHAFLRDNQQINLGSFSLQAISTPGHTLGSMVFFEKNMGWLFSGDTLFADNIGRYDLPTSSKQDLSESIGKISGIAFSMLFPGHGKTPVVKDQNNLRHWINFLKN